MLRKGVGKRLVMMMAPSSGLLHRVSEDMMLAAEGTMMQVTGHRTLMSALVRRAGPLTQQAAYHTSTPCSTAPYYGKLDNDVIMWEARCKEKRLQSNNNAIVDYPCCKKNFSSHAASYERNSPAHWWKPDSLTGVWYPEGMNGIEDTPSTATANTEPSNKVAAISSKEQEDAWWVSMEELPDLDRKPSKNRA
jgi:hypothetical protein